MKLFDSSFLSDSNTTLVLDCAVSFLGVVLFFYESSKYFMAEKKPPNWGKGCKFWILIKHFGPFPDLVRRGGGEVVGDGSLNFPAGSRKLEIENQFWKWAPKTYLS